MAKRKKQNKNWIYVVLIVLALVMFSNYQPVDDSPVQITARYYDAGGNLIGTSGRGLALQSILSPGIEEITSNTVGIQLVAEVTNTGNIAANIVTSDVYILSDSSTKYVTTPEAMIVSPGNSQAFTSEIVDVSNIIGGDIIRIEFGLIGDGTAIGEFYDWQFDRDSGLCYQESADTPDQTGVDGDCGLDYSGSYTAPNGLRAVSSLFHITYVKPSSSPISATWEVKHGNSANSVAYSIPILPSCFDADDNNLLLRFYSHGQIGATGTSYPQCYDGVAWQTIGNTYTGGTCSGSVANGNGPLFDGDFNTKSASIYSKWDENSWRTTTDCNSDIYEEAINWGFAEECLQEQADESTACGGLGTGEYSFAVESVIQPEGEGYIYSTYDKPLGSLSTSKWNVNHGTFGAYDVDIPSACWDEPRLKFRQYSHFNSYEPGVVSSYGQCYDGSSWQTITQVATQSGNNGFSIGLASLGNAYDGDSSTFVIYGGYPGVGLPMDWRDCGYSYQDCVYARLIEESMSWKIGATGGRDPRT